MLLIFVFLLHLIVFYELFKRGKFGKEFFLRKNFLREFQWKKGVEHEAPKLLDSLAQGIRAGLNMEGAFKRVWEDKSTHGECLFLVGKIVVKMSAGSRASDAVVASVLETSPRPELARLRQALLSLASLQRTGGDTVRMLTEASEAARKAIFLRRRASALAAQMRLQAIVISLAPSGVVLVLTLVSPSSLAVFWQDTVGMAMSFVLLAANATGVFFLHKIAKSWER